MSKQTIKNIIVDDMLLTTNSPTTAGSKMLEGYQSLIASEAVLRAEAVGYVVNRKAPVGEFAIDLLGETSLHGTWMQNGILENAVSQLLLREDVMGALCFDANGYPRRAAAQTGLICLKPTYGAISREGVVSVVPSGETVDILSESIEECRELFNAVTEQKATDEKKISRVAVFTSLNDGINHEVKQKISTAVSKLENNGISITYIENNSISLSKAAWNIILCAELCKSTARYDGVRFGHRSKNFSGLDELYSNSRTEGLGDLVKAAILYGAEILSTENYKKVYEKALRIRRVIVNEFEKLFETYDAVLLPVCSAMMYSTEQIEVDKYIAFDENRFTAPASLSGLPTVVAGHVQMIGRANAEHALLDVAKILVGEGV